MLDKRSNNTEHAPTWRILRFFGLDDSRNKTGPTARNQPKEPEERKQQFAIWYIFAAFLGVMLIQYLWIQYTQIETIPYSQFEQLLDGNKISEVLVGSDTIQGTLKEPFPDGRNTSGNFNPARMSTSMNTLLRPNARSRYWQMATALVEASSRR